jgi:hypothetical protein
LDLRRPQDYFHRLWSLTLPAAKLADATRAVDEPDRGDVSLEDGDEDCDSPHDAST